MSEQSEIRPTYEQVKNVLGLLEKKGIVYPCPNLPDSKVFPTWKLELVINSVRTNMYHTTRSGFNVKIEGNRFLQHGAVPFGWYEPDTDKWSFHLKPVFYAPDAEAPRAIVDIGRSTTPTERSRVFIPTNPIPVDLYLDKDLEMLLRFFIRTSASKLEYKSWVNYIKANQHVFPTTTRKTLEFELTNLPFKSGLFGIIR